LTSGIAKEWPEFELASQEFQHSTEPMSPERFDAALFWNLAVA